jgi:hypothetical protein
MCESFFGISSRDRTEGATGQKAFSMGLSRRPGVVAVFLCVSIRINLFHHFPSPAASAVGLLHCEYRSVRLCVPLRARFLGV